MRKRLVTGVLLLSLTTFALAGCGSKKSSDETKAATVKIDKATEATTTVAAKESSTTEAATTEATKTTTAAATTATTAASSTSTLASRYKASFNGATFALNDSADSFISKLGSQTEPSKTISSCILVKTATKYAFGNMTLEVEDASGKLGVIKIMDNGASDKSATVNGIGLGSTEASVKAAFPDAVFSTAASLNNYDMKDSTAELQVMCKDGVVIKVLYYVIY